MGSTISQSRRLVEDTCNTPCARTHIHLLTCGHLIYTPLFSLSSTLCASNCLSAYEHRDPTDTPFLCPLCYELFLQALHRRGFAHGEQANPTRVRGGNTEFNRWCDVQAGKVSFEKVCREGYKRRWKGGGKRACKSIEGYA
jgi:hypothetical protein